MSNTIKFPLHIYLLIFNSKQTKIIYKEFPSSQIIVKCAYYNNAFMDNTQVNF